MHPFVEAIVDRCAVAFAVIKLPGSYAIENRRVLVRIGITGLVGPNVEVLEVGLVLQLKDQACETTFF